MSRTLKQRFNKTRITLLIVLNFLILLLLFIKYIDYRYEYAVYRSLVTSNLDRKSEVNTFKNLVSLTYRIQTDRRYYMRDMYGMFPFKSRWFRSGDIQLLDATGTCGNFSHVLAELCQAAGYPVRMVQLKYGSGFGGHNIVEVFVGGRWVAADEMAFSRQSCSILIHLLLPLTK